MKQFATTGTQELPGRMGLIVCFQAGQIGAADATPGAGVLGQYVGFEPDLVRLVVMLIEKSFLLEHGITMFAGKRMFISIHGLELSDVLLHGCQLPLSELAFCPLVVVLLQDV